MQNGKIFAISNKVVVAMQAKPNLSLLTLIMMISFASVNAVLFTPALPDITVFFAITDKMAQYTVSWFLIGYAFGQLIYGPLASRFGRKPALYIGIGVQIAASLGCVLSASIYSYPLLVVSRFFVALGAGVGLNMTFTLVNEYNKAKAASQRIAYVMLAFSIMPGLGVALGGILNAHFGWTSCFIAGVVYGVILLVYIIQMPNIEAKIDSKALRWSHLQNAYGAQFGNFNLLAGGLLMGCASSFLYMFAALGPFIAINTMGMSSVQYGIANVIPSVGLVLGSFCSAQLVKTHSLGFLIKSGLGLCTLGTALMVMAMGLSLSPWWSLFLPMVIIYLGLPLVLANASSMAMSLVKDKAHGSAMMSFLNMGLATFVVLSLGLFQTHAILLPVIYFMLCALMVPLYYLLVKLNNSSKKEYLVV